MGNVFGIASESREKVMAINFNDSIFDDNVQLLLGKKYEIKVEEGRVFVVRKKLKYPKIYEECCKIVNANPYIRLIYDLSKGQRYSYDADNLQLYKKIRQLLICRNAYWKIAGEEMGLGKPWEPNWATFEDMPAIFRFRYNIVCDSIKNQHCLLVFPTEEMRNAFYENFKDLIENCKELL